MTGLLKQIMKADTEGVKLRLIVVCGKNQKLFYKAEKLVQKRGYDNVTVLGFTDKLDVYYSAADFIFCRGGSGAVTEAAKKGVPFAVREGVINQEKENAKFFAKYGGCFVMKHMSDAKRIIKVCMVDKSESNTWGGYHYGISCQPKASIISSLIFACKSENNLKFNYKKREVIYRFGEPLHAFIA